MAMSKTLTEAFEAFWAAYPRRPDNPKAAARVVFERRVREGADPAAIVGAAGRYAAAVVARKLDAPFIPHARTWISQRRYEDYPEDVQASAPVEPTPEHPLAWIRGQLPESKWASWIAPLRVLEAAHPVLIIAPTSFALDHVRSEWGYLFRAHYGPDVAWAVQPKEPT